jgi:hypothetical protein
MQDQFEPAGEAAIADGERSFVVSLRVDWNRNGLYDHAMSDMSKFVHTATTDRALEGSSPAALSLVEGSASAEFSTILAGEDSSGRSLASIFSPYQINSPFWAMNLIGCEVTYEIGVDTGPLGVLWYPQFIGNIRSISPNRGENNVEITALDRAELLRKPVMFANWAVSERQANNGRLAGQLMESHHMIDLALRQCDVSASPWRPITSIEVGGDINPLNGTQVYLTGNGGVTPLVGWMDNQTHQEFPDTEYGIPMYEAIGVPHPQAPDTTKVPCVFSALGNTPNDDSLLYWARDRSSINTVASHVMGFTLIQGVGQNPSYWSTMADTLIMSVGLGQYHQMEIWMGAGQVWSVWRRISPNPSPLSRTSSKVNIPAGGDCSIYVCWDAYNAAGPKVYVEADSNNNGTETLSAVTFSGVYDPFPGLVQINRQVAMQDVYFTSTNFGGISTGSGRKPKSAKYASSLDRGLNRLSYMPVNGKPEAWEIVKEVAAAELGAVFWDEEGKFLFWNFETIQEKRDTIVREITLDDLTALDITSTIDSVRNIYAMDQIKARAVWNNAYISQDIDEFFVPPGTEREFHLYIDDIVSPEPGLFTRYKTTGGDPVSTWTDAVQNGYVFQMWNGSSWQEAVTGNTAGVDIECFYDTDGFVTVKIWNGWDKYIRLASGANDDGGPKFHMKGTHAIKYDNQTVTTQDDASVAKYGPQVLSLSGPWYQDTSNFNDVLNKYLAKTTTPSPTTDSITIVGDPRLQLADAVRIKDVSGFGERFDVQIYGIRRTYSVDSGLTDTLSVEMLPAAGRWDDPIYGIWGSTFVWG